jgi:hypothetical protein
MSTAFAPAGHVMTDDQHHLIDLDRYELSTGVRTAVEDILRQYMGREENPVDPLDSDWLADRLGLIVQAVQGR